MIYKIKSEPDEPVVLLGSEIVYGQRTVWCGGSWRPLRMNLLRTRQFFDYDRRETLPVILWLTGGGFTNHDRNVYAPELTWFAKRGFAVVSIDYSVTSLTRFPDQLRDIQEAIGYLRNHGEGYGLDTDRMVIWGESAGGYLSLLTALAGQQEKEYGVCGAAAYYPVVSPRMEELNFPPYPPDFEQYPALETLVNPATPPMLLLHGDSDSFVNLKQSERMYDALQKNSVPSDLYILHGADHADAAFFQPEVKQIVLEFCRKVCRINEKGCD